MSEGINSFIGTVRIPSPNQTRGPGSCGSFSCLLILLMAVISGCGDHSSKGDKEAASFRVAVVVPGSTADQGWNYCAKEGALLIEKELRLAEPVTFVENVEASQRKSALRNFGRQGYRLVICHGYEFNQVVREIAGDFSDTVFVISGYDQPDQRFGSIVYQLGEAAYLAGAMAAKVTQSGHVGFIAAQQVPPVELCYRGFRNGFLQHAPQGSVLEPVYIEGTNPWEDSAAAKVKTQALLRVSNPRPIDVLFQNADAASRGIFEAVQEHPGRIFVFGANRDQNATTATTRIVASAVIHVDRAFLRVAQAVKAGTYTPHVESETLKSGGIELVLNPRLAELVGADVAANASKMLSDLSAAVRDGHVNPYNP